MKRWLPILAMVAIPGLVGLVVYYHRTALERRLERGRSLVGSKPGGAYLAEIVRRFPDSAEAHFLRARQHRLEEHLADAQSELARAAELGWPRAQVERERLFCVALTSFPQVQGRLLQMLDSTPEDREVLISLGLGFERSGSLSRAEALADRILARSPEDGEALFLRGRIRYRQRHLEHARIDLQQALDWGADRLYESAARMALANCLLDLGQFEEALVLYRLCHANEATNPIALFGLGRTAIHLNRWDEAQQAMEAVLTLRPDHPDTLLELARIHEYRGELVRTLELLRRAEGQVPDRPELLSQMAKVLRALNHPDQAADYARRYTQLQERTSRRRHKQSEGLDDRDLPTKSRNALDR